MINTVDKYKDSLYIRFNESGDIYKGITKVPHYKTWIKLLNHLKKRGFAIKTANYFIRKNWGLTYHKIAIKNNVAIYVECMESQIQIKFGDVKNLWDDEHNFWSLTDRRSEQLIYLEAKRVELEVSKLLSLFPKDKIKIESTKELSSTEKILKDKKESSHNRDKSKLDELGLDGIVYQMSEYDLNQNSNDRDKKRINCGELKYFYDYDKRLKCGRVYHQLNNRWYVLAGGEVDYVSSFDLFDYSSEPRRKQLKTEEKINRLESELRKYESKKNYLRCMSINKQIDKLKSNEKLYYVWSLKWGKWWGANNSGYTSDKRMAGVYLESNILRNQSYYNDGVSTKAILA